MLNQEQQTVYEDVLRHRAKIIFLDAPGGTGKTFLLNLIFASLRKNGEIALTPASSGIAATLLDGGRTAHSTFKLPLNIATVENPSCNITKHSGDGQVLKQCKLIVWDECTMAHRKSLKALDATLRDLKDNPNLMGGIVVLLAGDFRQILPVVKNGTPAQELDACLKQSHVWKNVIKCSLTTNMRVHLHNDENAQAFTDRLLNIGNGSSNERFSSDI